MPAAYTDLPEANQHRLQVELAALLTSLSQGQLSHHNSQQPSMLYGWVPTLVAHEMRAFPTLSHARPPQAMSANQPARRFVVAPGICVCPRASAAAHTARPLNATMASARDRRA